MMWIEVNLSINDPTEGSEDRNEWHTLFNSKLVNWIAPSYYKDGSYLELYAGGVTNRFFTFSEQNLKAIYNGFLLALQGQEVVFDEWGFIKPLLNDRREALHKYLLYIQTIDDLTTVES